MAQFNFMPHARCAWLKMMQKEKACGGVGGSVGTVKMENCEVQDAGGTVGKETW